jgi:hypothetical protein
MTIVNVVIAVNVTKAIAENNLGKYVFLVDSTGYSGDGSEGSNELLTTCQNGDTIVWSVIPIDPGTTAAITGFSGQAVPDMVNPVKYPQYSGTVFGGRVNMPGTRAQYTATLLLEGTNSMSFDPFITATNPTL